MSNTISPAYVNGNYNTDALVQMRQKGHLHLMGDLNSTNTSDLTSIEVQAVGVGYYTCEVCNIIGCARKQIVLTKERKLNRVYITATVRFKSTSIWLECPRRTELIPDSEVHGAHMGPIWVLPATDGLHVGPMDLAIRDTMSVDALVPCVATRSADLWLNMQDKLGQCPPRGSKSTMCAIIRVGKYRKSNIDYFT